MSNAPTNTIGGMKITALFWLGLAVTFAVAIPVALPKETLAIGVAVAGFLANVYFVQFLRVATLTELVASIAAHKLGWIATVAYFAVAMTFMFSVMRELEMLTAL